MNPAELSNPIYETETFTLHAPDTPFVDRLEGGHLRLVSKIQVADRTKLTPEQAIEYTRLSMIAGEGLGIGLAARGIDIGIVNYQEMGNWSVFKPGGRILHMHIFGRAKTATIQKYGEAVQLPLRNSGFYDGFKPLDTEDLVLIRKAMDALASSEAYSDVHWTAGKRA